MSDRLARAGNPDKFPCKIEMIISPSKRDSFPSRASRLHINIVLDFSNQLIESRIVLKLSQ